MPEPVTWTLSADEALKRLKGRLFATTTEAAHPRLRPGGAMRKAIDAGEIPSVRVGATRRIPVSWITQQARLGGGNAASNRTPPAPHGRRPRHLQITADGTRQR